MPPQPGSPGRAGQAYTGLGSFRRAQGAQSRWLPQAGLALERTGQRAAAGAAGMREEWMRLWGRLAERERAEKLAAIGGLGRTLGLGIEKWRGGREEEAGRRWREEQRAKRERERTISELGGGVIPRPTDYGLEAFMGELPGERGRGFPRRLEDELSEEELREFLARPGVMR